jgi:hypothetical protein
MHVYLQILCVHAMFHENRIFFHGLCKKYKNRAAKRLILVPYLSFLYRPYKKSVFLETT